MAYDRKHIKIHAAKKITELGKSKAEVGPRQAIAVAASPWGDNNLGIPGTKCEHGVYIPASAVSPNHAPFCSLCYPYEIKLKT